ncbi:MAG TPA: ester cyclase [Steroidobacter sp.]|uniref:ester cyclase n=1 Tax=Steroidobacter sp. TaxID=1978227 RepID=UPI002ED86321
MTIKAAFLSAILCLCCGAALGDEQRNVATAKRVFLEKMGEGRFDKLDEIYAPGFVAHGPSKDYTLDEDNASGKEWRKACPDLKVSVLRTVAEHDLVAVHWNAKCTNTVAAAGLPGQGGKASVDGMTFFRFADAKIAEEWGIIDIATMVRQLGIAAK